MIGLMDCNNFFVSCERLFRPDLAKRPVVVLSSNDGCVVARSQEIKDMGIPMGIPYFKVKQEFSQAGVVCFSSNFTLYRDISSRVMKALAIEVGEIEQYSIDESFFTLPDDTQGTALKTIRDRVMAKTGIPVSIGGAKTKTIAKYASSIAKKQAGVYVCVGEEWRQSRSSISCGEVWGIGSGLAQGIRSLGIDTVEQFVSLPAETINNQFGVVGRRLSAELREEVCLPVVSGRGSLPQSIASTRSFSTTTQKLSDLEAVISGHVAACATKLRKNKLAAGNIKVFVAAGRYSDFSHRTGMKKIELPIPTADTVVMTKLALQALQEVFDKDVPYKKAGVVVYNLVPKNSIQANLFSEENTRGNTNGISEIADLLNDRYGLNTLVLASQRNNPLKTNAKLRSPSYTTLWKDIPKIKAK